jgi:PAS domain S-box-containing protein
MTMSEHRKADEEGSAQTANLEALLLAGLDLAQNGVAIFDSNLRLVVRNDRFLTLRHFPPDLCVPGVSLKELFRFNAERGDYGQGDLEAEVDARVAEAKRFKTRAVEQEMPDGRILLIRSDPIPIGGVMVTFSDVTDMRRAEQALRKSEERHTLVQEAMTEGLYDWNVTDDSVYFSQRLAGMFGAAEHGKTRDAWNESVHPDDRRIYRDALVELFKGRVDHLNCEYRVRNKQGDYLWLHDSASAVRDENGRVVRLVGALADVNERKRIEAALKESEARYALATASVGFGVYEWDVVNDHIDYSPGMYRAISLGHEDLRTAADWDRHMHPDDRGRFRQALLAHFKRLTERFEIDVRYRSSDSEWRWARQHGLAERAFDDRVERMIGSVGDVTEEKRLQAALDTARQQLLEAVESISEGFLLTDETDLVVLMNSKLREFYVEGADLLTPGRHFADILRAQATRGVLATDGKPVHRWVEERLARRRNPKGPFEYKMADGRWIRISERHTTEGGVVGIYTDISDDKRREAELSAARDQAMAATEAKSRFLANMSHELRTPLTAIIGITTLLERKAAAEGHEQYLDPLGRISRAGDHLIKLISEVLDLSKIEAGRIDLFPENIDLQGFIDEIAALCEPLVEQNHNRLLVECPSDIGVMQADPMRAKQVLLNLLSNACRFTENGTISLSVRRNRDADGNWITATVQDTGIGIAEDHLDQVFDEFSQADASATRRHGGTGLGLAISRHLCRLMGGEITAESELGIGSAFTVRLPTELADSRR